MDEIKRLLTLVALLLVQVLILNHIHLFGVATPLLYIVLTLSFRRNYPRWAVIAWSFLLGLLVDIFGNTPGVAAASMTFLGLLQPYLLSAFVQRDSAEDLKPSLKSLGTAKYTYYVLIATAVYCLMFFTLEAFNFFNWQLWIASIGGSTALTIVLILVIDNLRK